MRNSQIDLPDTDTQDDTTSSGFPQPHQAAMVVNDDVLVKEHTTLRGSVDEVTAYSVRGWVWDSDDPLTRVQVELHDEEGVLATAVADQERADLLDAGIGDGRHAYDLVLTPGSLPPGRHMLHLRRAGSSLALPGSPVTLDVIAPRRPPSFRYYLDEITDNALTGWFAATDEPSRRCVIALKEAGQTLSRAVASRYRPDLLAAGIGDGCHAFVLQMPRSLLDGEQHLLEVVEEETGFPLTESPIAWRSTAGTAETALTGLGSGAEPITAEAKPPTDQHRPVPKRQSDPTRRTEATEARQPQRLAPVTTRILFDISDLVYYLGHHSNLTGIQRVQSSIALAMIRNGVLPQAAVTFLTFNARTRQWAAVPTGFLISLLEDLFLPEPQRLVSFPAEEARYGMLPGAVEFDGSGLLDSGAPSVLCLLGAAWVQRDYFHRVLSFKRRFGTRFVMMVHDLIPIYARETCDQGTALVFEEFLRRAVRHTDHYLCVSESTARDLRRYISTFNLPPPRITVSRNGSSFDEFLPDSGMGDAAGPDDLPERFVLFVATIEGRKNHKFMLDVWQRMVRNGDDPPTLVCVGRVGWKSQAFIAELVETNYLDGKVVLLRDISDAHLKLLYSRCLFTVFPSLYEGWGLPAGESLAMGKVCVCSDRSSLPEVAGEFGAYIDIENLDQATRVIRGMISDDAARQELEAQIRDGYKPITWQGVARRVVEACQQAAETEWEEPYPFAAVPYASEISFAWLGRDADGTFGDDMLTRVADTRRGYFLAEPLQEQSFLRGEDARGAGAWGEPENWGDWLCQGAGEMTLGLGPNDSQIYYVFLRVRASGPVANGRVKLSANGETAWEGAIGVHSRDIWLRVRRRVRGPGAWWRLRVRVEVDLTDEVRAALSKVDSRIPTVGFERLVVVPEDDLKARLDVMTRLFLC